MSQVKAVDNALLRLSLAATCAAGLVGAAWAAEAPAPARAPAATPGTPAAAPKTPGAAAPAAKPKDIWEEAPYQMYAQSGRVDPFTRGKPKLPGGPKRPTVEGVDKALRAYDEAEALLVSEKENRYDECRRVCEKGMQDLRQIIVEISNKEELAKDFEKARELMDRFLLLANTAKRLKQRQLVEADFAKLKITVDGIVWTEQSPSAAISGKVCNEGALLAAGVGGKDFIQVHRIRRDAVVFLYRGVQISVRLDRGGR